MSNWQYIIMGFDKNQLKLVMVYLDPIKYSDLYPISRTIPNSAYLEFFLVYPNSTPNNLHP